MKLHQHPVTTVRLRLKMALLITSGLTIAVFIVSLFYGTIGTSNLAKATTTETIDSGSYIVNMGVTPQTIGNGLKPYGLVYDMIVNYSTPVKWVIEPAKAKDGTDFTYNAVAYKGGPFIIPAANITSTIKTRITYWQTQGVQGIYTTSAVSVPVYTTMTNFPKMTIDNSDGKQNIIAGYFSNAGIPTTSYTLGIPTALSNCHDLWINPHGDPVWSTHGRLYSFVSNDGSFIWSQCHAVSVLEGCTNPSSPFEQLNFLTTNGLKCYSGGKCAPGSTETHGGNATTPFIEYYPADPIMQFMGTMDGATTGGSENWYQPNSTGAWRATTKVLVASSDGVSPRQGVVMVYGPAYGLPGKGWAMYEGGHDLDGSGSTAEKVAAQRAFFNYMLFAGITKQLKISNLVAPTSFRSLETNALSLSVSSGTPAYSYQWTSSVGGSFSSATSASTNYTAPTVSSITAGVFTCVVTDVCGRRNFITSPFIMTPSALPVSLVDFTLALNKNNTVSLKWQTASEKDNDYFTIERSGDGKNFMPIDRVDGAGNSNVMRSYTYKDEQPLAGISYYRLKQTDFNGDSETFKVLSVKIADVKYDKPIKVYPNPFKNYFTLQFETDEDKEVSIMLYNLNGTLIRNEKIMATSGNNSYQFNPNQELKQGTYILKIADDKTIIGSAKINCINNN